MRVTNQKILLLLSLLLVTFSIPLLVFAHVLKTDGSIGAVLHIDPEDDPVANKPAGFFFEFKDIKNKFDPASCECNFSIIQAGKQIYSQPLFPGTDKQSFSMSKPSLDNASVFYTFPERDIYQIIVDGKPKKAGAFANFKLVYDVRVARGENAIAQANTPVPVPKPNWLSVNSIYLMAGIVILIALPGFFIFQKMKKQKISPADSPPQSPEPVKMESEPSNQTSGVQ